MQCLCIKVTGTVQGVFFRANTKEKADELGIKGFVKNEPDGSVYIEAVGEDTEMKRFVDWCGIGPKSASVERVDVTPKELPEFDSFEVRR